MRTSRSSKPRIIITMGDPSGIGPEVTLKALASPKVKGLADFLVIGEESACKRGSAAKASVEYLDRALEILKARQADAIVTAPINKASIRAAGLKGFQGHTEYFAGHTRTKKFAMLFVGLRLKVALVTRHLPLKLVPRMLTSEKIYNTILLVHESMKKDFSISAPRLGILGLNPHAGEDGAFGDEEARIIIPAMKRAARTAKNLCGPVPADVAFHDASNGKYDALVAMYHDQALTAFKTLYFTSGVNMTLGLPFIRTSPDHGTAFDIAGKGIADPSSMIEAIRLACDLARKRC